VARVAWIENAQWQSGGGTAPLGAWLKPGRVQVQSGKLALAFDSGAEVILEGPCVFELTGPNGGKLQRGSLSSHVPPEAVGFRVETPRSNIVDRGTDFAVVVGDDGGTEVHVVKGLVDVAPAGGSGVVSVRTAEAVRVIKDAARRVGFSNKRFRSPTALNLSQPARAAHWSFDAPEPFADRSGTLPDGPYPVRFQNGTPESIEGPFGRALRLDGTNRHGVTDFRGIGGHAPRTIAFWVRIPRDTTGANAYSVLAWGRAFPRKGNKWQIA